MAVHCVSSPPKLHKSGSSPSKTSLASKSEEVVKSEGKSGLPVTKKTTIVTRKIKVASSTKKKLGMTTSSEKIGGVTTRTTIIKKVIRKKKVSNQERLFGPI